MSRLLRFSFAKIRKRDVFVVASKRTPIASYLGAYKNLNAPLLGAHAIKAALESINLPGDSIDEVILGNVCSAGLGQNPAR